MANRITKARLAAFQLQSGRCYYCGSCMWLKDRREFAKKNSISVQAAAIFQCTAEHLTARCEGGSDSKSNIVAACLNCNSIRHKRKKPPTPTNYKADIQRRLKKGKWLPETLRHIRSQTV